MCEFFLFLYMFAARFEIFVWRQKCGSIMVENTRRGANMMVVDI